MKYKKYAIMPMILALLSVATSCSQEDMPPAATDSDVVEVTATIGSTATRVSQSADNEYVFNFGDKIHIVGWYGTEGWAEDLSDFKADANVSFGLYDWWNDAVSTFNGSRWKTEPYMRWQNGEDLKHHFIAWWPEDFAKSTDNFTAIPVQITGDVETDDILRAHWTGTRPDDNTLRLQFNHLMARFDVHLKFRTQYTEVGNISIKTNLRNNAKCDLLTGNITEASGNDIVMTESEHPDSQYDWSGTCITVPHEFSSDDVLLTLNFTADGKQKAITYRHPTSLTFQSGHRTTLTLYIGKDKVKLSSITAAPWETENGGNLETE